MLERAEVRGRFGDDLVVWVRPDRVTHYVGKSVPLLGGADRVASRVPALVRRRVAQLVRRVRPAQAAPFFIPAHHVRHPVPIESTEKYQKILDLIACGDAYGQSLWFDALKRSVEQRGSSTHKAIQMRTIDDVHAFFQDYVLPLVSSMKHDGYDVERGAPFGGAIIGRDGALYKANAGDHRFFVARVVGASPVPLRVVGIHEAWPRAMGLEPNLAAMPAVIDAVQVLGQRYRS